MCEIASTESFTTHHSSSGTSDSRLGSNETAHKFGYKYFLQQNPIKLPNSLVWIFIYLFYIIEEKDTPKLAHTVTLVILAYKQASNNLAMLSHTDEG